MPSPDRHTPLHDFVAQSSAMLDVLSAVHAYARARTPLVLVGATGTGKTTLAAIVHELSRRPGPLASHSAGEFDRHLEHSEIFGHERGAFTGAVARHIGVLEEAGDGTLLLDDFHHLRRSTQTLLLRALDRQMFRPVGARRDLPLRCRVIVGLIDEPDALVARGTLLAELRHRLGYGLIRMPTLAERPEDIPLLALRFLDRCPAETGVAGPQRFAPDVLSLFVAAAWPGNARQLAMAVRDAYLRAHSSPVIHLAHVPDDIRLPVRFERRGDPVANARAVQLALRAAGGEVARAARLLRTSRNTVYHYRGASERGLGARSVLTSAGQDRDVDTSVGLTG